MMARSPGRFDPKLSAASLRKITSLEITGEAENTLNALINEVPVDFIRYEYLLIGDVVELDGVRLASKEDITCMKLSATASRGTKKDFFDIYLLLNEYSLDEMFSNYERNIKATNGFIG